MAYGQLKLYAFAPHHHPFYLTYPIYFLNIPFYTLLHHSCSDRINHATSTTENKKGFSYYSSVRETN